MKDFNKSRTITIRWSEEDQAWLASASALGGTKSRLIADGPTPSSALTEMFVVAALLEDRS